MRFAIVVFPGTWSDRDCSHAITDDLGEEAAYVWHRERDLSGFDAVVLPGGFSYGDYLRCGAIARFSPVMEAVVEFAKAGKPVIGICNGFQVLCEAGLLPGVLMRNADLRFHCEDVYLRTENANTAFTNALMPGSVIRLPISHGEGNYYADAATLDALEASGRVAFRYCDAEGGVTAAANPNGSARNIAGVLNEAGNVLGMMPHPERLTEPVLGGVDGLAIFRSMVQLAATKAP
ncbi:MAG: phosphoribosylformylglycinamidine synthase subunit PurQ [Dehalococcoidia bacterium]|nr:phosphoribosylformylglycinamidine synthase subunit PurQ [Dehalococcoidia bacterium]